MAKAAYSEAEGDWKDAQGYWHEGPGSSGGNYPANAMISAPNADTPNITTTTDENGNLVFRGGEGAGGMPSYQPGAQPSYGGYGSPDYGNPFGAAGSGANQSFGNYGGGGGGYNSGWQGGMNYAPNGGQGMPNMGYSNPSSQSNPFAWMGLDANGAPLAGSSGRQSPGLGGTQSGSPAIGQMGGGFDPNSPINPFNQAQAYQGGPQSFFPQTGFQPGQQYTPGQFMGQTGFQPGNTDPTQYLTMAGMQQGGIGGPDTQAYNRYQSFLENPGDVMGNNPAYQAIMDAATQATQRQQLARGGNGGGTILAELAKTGAGVAGQFMPTLANMYQGGAQQEIGNWQAQNQANLGAGNLGQGLFGTANVANLGYGNLGLGMSTQGNAANLGYGNLANNMWNNAAQDQYNRAMAYGQMQNGAANTQSAALAKAQMNPANQYFMNQLTMQGY